MSLAGSRMSSHAETLRAQLEEVVQRGDPEEWLRVLLHESTRANNAEAENQRLRDALEVIAGSADTLDSHEARIARAALDGTPSAAQTLEDAQTTERAEES